MHIEHQLEEIIQQQRLQLFFASRLWLEARKENGQLRQVISILEARLEEAGVSTEAPPAPDNQPGLPLFRTFHETSPRRFRRDKRTETQARQKRERRQLIANELLKEKSSDREHRSQIEKALLRKK